MQLDKYTDVTLLKVGVIFIGMLSVSVSAIAIESIWGDKFVSSSASVLIQIDEFRNRWRVCSPNGCRRWSIFP